MNTFFNSTVEIEDPAGIFESDKELTVQMQYISSDKKFYIKVPLPKVVEPKLPKPKPVELYKGPFSGIVATQRVDGKLQLHWLLKEADKLIHLGRQTIDHEVKEAVDKIWEMIG